MKLSKTPFEEYLKVLKLKNFVVSAYTIIAFALSIATLLVEPAFDWSNKSLSVIPSLLGFTFAAFAILIGILSNQKLPSVASDEVVENLKGLKDSINRISMVFFHIIFVQTSAIIFSAIGAVFINNPLPFLEQGIGFLINSLVGAASLILMQFIGTFLFYYSIVLVISATSAVVRIQRSSLGASIKYLERQLSKKDP